MATTGFAKHCVHLPQVQMTTTDVLMNGVTIQDKPAHKQNGHNGLDVHVTKSAGNGSVGPYAVGDFEALFVFPPDKTRYFFLIPAKALLDQKVLSSGDSKGKTTITCYFSGYTKGSRGPTPICGHKNTALICKTLKFTLK